MKGEYSSIKQYNFIESIIIPPKNKFLSSTEYRTDGEVGYTSLGYTTENKRNHMFNSLEEEREKLFPLFSSLREVASNAAMDMDSSLYGRNEYLFHRTKKYSAFGMLRKIIQNNIIPGKEIESTVFDLKVETTLPLITAMSKGSEKENFREWYNYRTGKDYNKNAKLSQSEVMLEMRLLYMELRDFELLPKERKEQLMDFCLTFSRHIPLEYFTRYAA